MIEKVLFAINIADMPGPIARLVIATSSREKCTSAEAIILLLNDAATAGGFPPKSEPQVLGEPKEAACH